MKIPLRSTLVLWALTALCGLSRADAIYDVSLNTSSLINHPAGPFSILFAFVDGSGVGDGNNTVYVNAVNFHGGHSMGNPFTFGGTSGSLETGVSITDSSFLNLFTEEFTPGNNLTFSLDLTLNDDPSGTPDGLTMSILDSSGVPIPTLGPAGDYLLGAAIHASGPVFDLWGSDPNRDPSAGGPLSIPAPVVTPNSTVPEPSTLYLLACGCLAVSRLRALRVLRSQYFKLKGD